VNNFPTVDHKQVKVVSIVSIRDGDSYEISFTIIPDQEHIQKQKSRNLKMRERIYLKIKFHYAI
jgi:hypothetical protein